MNKSVKLILLILVSGAILYFSNLLWLSMHDRPSIRGNHVGLAFLSFITFWVLVLLINWLLKKKNKEIS